MMDTETDDVYHLYRMEKMAEAEMIGKLLKSATHCVLAMTKTKEMAEKTGIHGVLFICCGPGDDDAIGQIHLVKGGDRFSWRPPVVDVPIDGKIAKLPVFKGKMAEEVGEWAHSSYTAIKKEFGKVRYGHRYRVAGSKVTDETPEAVEAKA